MRGPSDRRRFRRAKHARPPSCETATALFTEVRGSDPAGSRRGAVQATILLMTRSRTALRALLSGVLFAVILGVLYYFSSGLHIGRVLLAGALFAVGTYLLGRRREKRQER